MTKRKGKILIGCSGWHYKHWIGTFYPNQTKQKDLLNYYHHHFNTVELNNPFYRLPSKATFEGWKNQTPNNFIFSVKGSRYISHQKKLHEAADALTTLMNHAEGLEHKLGPILFQLPPSWNVNSERLDSFLRLLPSHHRFTFEFRNHSWYSEEVLNLLRQYHVAFCIYHLAGHQSPEIITADFVYMRLHGPGNKYQGSYSTKELKAWAEKISQWSNAGQDVYCYFDNDQAGYAAFNAMKLIELTELVPAS